MLRAIGIVGGVLLLAVAQATEYRTTVHGDVTIEMPVTEYVPAPIDKTELVAMVSRLRELYAAAMGVRGQYPYPQSVEGIRACVTKYGYVRDEARSIREQALKIARVGYRVKLSMAAGDLFACAYCGGSGKSCPEVLPALDAVEAMLAEEP